VLACGDRKAGRWPLYSGTRRPRLRWPPHRLATFVVILGAFSASGCSYQLDTSFSKSNTDLEQLGSISQTNHSTAAAGTASVPPETDLAYARAVAADALARGSKDSSIPWMNPNTGASGNVTPLAATSSAGGFTCRDFLASYVLGQAQAWFQGEACRTEHGQWEVKSLKPLKQG
jgi:surface antigen